MKFSSQYFACYALPFSGHTCYIITAIGSAPSGLLCNEIKFETL